jgi:glycine dehydrogenase subunit 1
MPEDGKPFVYPYIPNSVPEARAEMLKEIGVESIEDLYAEVPDELRLHRKLNLPEPFQSEFDMRRHVLGMLEKNKTCEEYISFLGAGTWQHFVPAACDEINGRAEFVTAYAGAQYSDHGKNQVTFETQSMIGELVGLDAVSSGTYDGASAVSSAVMMGTRLSGRKEVLVPKSISPETRQHINNFGRSAAKFIDVNYDPITGKLDLNDLRAKISSNTGSVLFEQTNYFGVIDDQGAEVAKIAHDAGAEFIVSVDPISLGILAAPGEYGADIVCGELQPLGIHMQYGGGLSGFIATRHEPKYIAQIPTMIWTITEPGAEGERGFGQALHDRTSYVTREAATDFTGTNTALWFITAGVYMAVMGPQGMKEVGETILWKSQYAINQLAKVKGVKAPALSALPFKEFVVNFDGTGKTVKEINKALLAKGIFGGKDLSAEFPELGQSALYCVTEVISKDNIDTLVAALGEVLR